MTRDEFDALPELSCPLRQIVITDTKTLSYHPGHRLGDTVLTRLPQKFRRWRGMYIDRGNSWTILETEEGMFKARFP